VLSEFKWNIISPDNFLESFRTLLLKSSRDDITYNDLYDTGWYELSIEAANKQLGFCRDDNIIFDEIHIERSERMALVRKLRVMDYDKIYSVFVVVHTADDGTEYAIVKYEDLVGVFE